MVNESFYDDELVARATGGDNNFYDNQHRMRQIIGWLNHLAIHTRPDILFAVSNLATKIMDANEYYIEQAMHIMRYLKGTINVGLVFSSEVKMELIANVDASYLTHEDSKSHSGICYSLGEGNTACFFSRSAKQKLVTRSSAEAELYALELSNIDIQSFRAILKFFGVTQFKPTKINKTISLLWRWQRDQRNQKIHLDTLICDTIIAKKLSRITRFTLIMFKATCK